MKQAFRFPLKQHIGEQAVPAIVKGDRIVRGQLLALKKENTLSANIYSSVSGVVLEVNDKQIVIKADERQTEEYIPLKSNTPLELIEEAGIVGLGGAGFPTWAKLSKPFGEGGKIIVNAAECEPILSHNIKCIEENPEQLVSGMKIVMNITRAEEGVIAVKEKHHTAVRRLQEAIAGENMRVVLLPDLYPMGEERAVIREVTGNILPVNSIPIEAGVIVLNAETVCRIWEAVTLKKPLIDKNITVAGKLREDEKPVQVLCDVPLGMSVKDVFDMAGGVAEGYGELIMGGPFTGKRTQMDAPVIKTTGGLIATECFMSGPEKIGLLVCACGADKSRLQELAKSLGSEVAAVRYCKQAKEVKNAWKCENPGKCPGQVQKVLELKREGAQAILISNCTDCSNTVMSCAPQLGLPVYHCTDGALRAVNHPLIRKIHKNKLQEV